MKTWYLIKMHIAYAMHKKARWAYVSIHGFWLLYLYSILPKDVSKVERMLYPDTHILAYFLEFHVMMLFLITLLPTVMIISYQRHHELLLIASFSRVRLFITRAIALGLMLALQVFILVFVAYALLWTVPPLVISYHVMGGYMLVILIDATILLAYHLWFYELFNQPIFHFVLFVIIWFLRVVLTAFPKELILMLVHYFFPLVIIDNEHAFRYGFVYHPLHGLAVLFMVLFIGMHYYLKKDLHS